FTGVVNGRIGVLDWVRTRINRRLARVANRNLSTTACAIAGPSILNAICAVHVRTSVIVCHFDDLLTRPRWVPKVDGIIPGVCVEISPGVQAGWVLGEEPPRLGFVPPVPHIVEI